MVFSEVFCRFSVENNISDTYLRREDVSLTINRMESIPSDYKNEVRTLNEQDFFADTAA